MRMETRTLGFTLKSTDKHILPHTCNQTLKVPRLRYKSNMRTMYKQTFTMVLLVKFKFGMCIPAVSECTSKFAT